MARPKSPPAARLAREIVAYHFGSKVRSVRALQGGLTNQVFRVRHDDGEVVVRLGETGGKTEAFLKEHWAVERAAEAGIPVARILQVGSDVIEMPYMILEVAVGQPATRHAEPETILRRLGEVAARLHAIETHGFGTTFDWSRNTLSHCESWRDFLYEEFDWPARISVLDAAGCLGRGGAFRLTTAAEALVEQTPKPALNHGDLRLKNVFVDGDKITALLDWEDCESNAPRLWDLSIALHDLGPDGRQAFLEGYGLQPEDAIRLSPHWVTLNLLHYAPAVASATARKDKAALAWFHARLTGALDLFCS